MDYETEGLTFGEMLLLFLLKKGEAKIGPTRAEHIGNVVLDGIGIE